MVGAVVAAIAVAAAVLPGQKAVGGAGRGLGGGTSQAEAVEEDERVKEGLFYDHMN